MSEKRENKPAARVEPKITEAREDANSRTTLEVDPAWLERNRASLDRVSPAPDRPSMDRRTMDVDPAWLERDSKPGADEPIAERPRSAIPPPLPPSATHDESEDEEDAAPVRSAIPPPLPKS